MSRDPELFTVEQVRFRKTSMISWHAGPLAYPVRRVESGDGPRFVVANRRFDSIEEAGRHSVKLARSTYDHAKKLVTEYEAALAAAEAKP
jgi:hypothetical protein